MKLAKGRKRKRKRRFRKLRKRWRRILQSQDHKRIQTKSMKIKFNFENCFGIAKMNAELDFSGHNTTMVYAPNGMMKSSFANTLHALAFNAALDANGKGKSKQEPIKICDKLHDDRPSKADVKLDDGTDFNPLHIFVANPDNEDYDATQSVSTFLASENLRKRYEKAVKAIDKAKNTFIKRLKNVSGSTNCEEELIETFAEGDNSTIYDIIELLKRKLDEREHTLYTIRFNDVFDTKGLVEAFLNENRDKLETFVSRYNTLLSQSPFFHVSDDGKTTFGTYQAKSLSNSLKDGSFFGVNHKLLLKDDSNIVSHADLESRIEAEIKNVEDDEELQAVFAEISAKLDANPELRAFKNCIKDNSGLLAELADYNGFREKLLLGYLADESTGVLFNELYTVFMENKDELTQILQEASAEQNRWKNIVDLFNARFYVPFEAKIENQVDIILRAQTPKLTFFYHNQGENIERSRKELLSILSKGEMRAFFILQMLFEIEARKDDEELTLVVLDDIADSFDYQNKFAIIEYLNDIHKYYSDKFKVILLTHNFDFYRNATLRLGIKQCYMAKKDNQGQVSMERGIYIMRTPLEIEIKSSDVRSFISMIPFTRNIVEYTEGAKYDSGLGAENNDYTLLTQCLHLKDRTKDMTDTEVDIVIRRHIKNPQYHYIPSGSKIIDLIYMEAESISGEDSPKEIAIENKVILSIAIRLKAETFMKGKLLSLEETEASLKTGEIQTTYWLNKMRERVHDSNVLSILERVNMMTPECIHINSFMFEPLIDMSIRHLVKLYNDVKNL